MLRGRSLPSVAVMLCLSFYINSFYIAAAAAAAAGVAAAAAGVAVGADLLLGAILFSI